MRLTEKMAGLREKIMQFKGKSEIEISKIINTEVETKVNELLENKDVLKNVLAKIKEQKTKISNLNIQDLVAKIKEIFTIKNKNFFEEVVKTHISDIQANFKGYKDITGLLITLAMTPFTCMALNWIYPKFMDYFFPHLGNKANGGKK
jgi:hypothetical protein